MSAFGGVRSNIALGSPKAHPFAKMATFNKTNLAANRPKRCGSVPNIGEDTLPDCQDTAATHQPPPYQ